MTRNQKRQRRIDTARLIAIAVMAAATILLILIAK